ncbi:MAG: UDP-N-acetylmuramoyl-L-alanyl-D-glutamate--2,6-diaminopimelate ligase [Pseudomonadota bacterium]|nr:UDP-N-acetylmuramoyl-L-alanyl-D-glutamate--2,6-diaminopimelate ligase [Pseudomonadota bacterium]
MRLIDMAPEAQISVKIPPNSDRIEITGLSTDSRKVRPGYLFAALPGVKADGRDFIENAINNGAAAVLAPEGTETPKKIPLATSPDARAALAHMASEFYSFQPAIIAAVTGTNGKTSVTHFTQQIWNRLGHNTSSIGTLGLQTANPTQTPNLTTPDPIALHSTLASLNKSGITHVVLEASSHGLDQKRIDGVKLSAAGFTNFSHDHLDYHGNVKKYLSAKARLFSDILPTTATAILNADNREYPIFSKAFGGQKLTYGKRGKDLTLKAARPTELGVQVQLGVMGKNYDLHIPLVGMFQSYNVLCAAGLAIACGGDVDNIIETLDKLKCVPGRMQLAGQISGGKVYVDYAHTPDAVENVLKAARKYAKGRLLIVIGCGGERDRAKRSLIGKIIAKNADVTIITDDNPRSEDPKTIRAEIMVTAKDAYEIGNRASAIVRGISLLQHDDVLIIAGKGHEKTQIIGETLHPFDDLEIARQAIIDSGGGV